MASARSKLLSWEPTAEDAAMVPSSEIIGDEHDHGVVLPSTPRTPRSEFKACPITNAYLRVAVAEMQEMLKLQGAELMQRMESLMWHQEQTITRLLEGQEMRKNSRVMPANHFASMSSSPLSVRIVQAQETYEYESKGVASMLRRYSRSFMRSTPAETYLQTLWQMASGQKATSELPTVRQSLQNILHSPIFDAVLTFIVFMNTILIIVETDHNAKCNADEVACAPAWVESFNLVLLNIYTLEAVAALYAFRWKLCFELHRLFEMLIVIVGWLDFIIFNIFGDNWPSVQALRLMRLTRLLRGMRLFHMCPELKCIAAGFVNAMRTMCWGTVMLMLLLIVVAIAAVELVNPVNRKIQHEDTYCEHAFSSVWNSTIWFFQTTVSGDSWGHCSLPIIKAKPISFLCFGGALVGVQVGFLNLVMSVIIDRVADARACDAETKIREKEKEIERSRKRWFDMFDKLDTDGNGSLSLDEIIQGFDAMPNFSTDLKLLGIQRQDLPRLLKLMDEDNDQQVSMDELVTMFDMAVHFDNKMHQVTLGMQMRVIGQRLEMRIKKLEHEIKLLLFPDYTDCRLSKGAPANGVKRIPASTTLSTLHVAPTINSMI